jgi:Icc-related predicted phosphoesterase
MQIISDTHGSHYGVKVPEGDVLIHCGDVCSHGSMVDTLDFLRWFNTHPHPHKIFVAGNHDIIFEKDPGLIQTLLKQFPDIHYLEDSGVTIDGLKFWGSPYTPRFFNWSFNADRGEDIKRHWDMIPEGTDVLITHGPPYNICDEAPRVGMARATEHVGCKDLLDATLRVAPKLHAFGHIHYSGGKSYIGPKTTFANVSLLNEGYVIEYPPMVFDIDFEGTVSIV